MKKYRITKYNPKFRNKNGTYLKNEWTSYSDIGKVFDEKIFTLEEYIEIENSYLNSIESIINYYQLEDFKVVDIELDNDRHRDIEDIELSNLFSRLCNGYCFKNTAEIIQTIKLILREYIWAKIVSSNNFTIEFGFDYYMYILIKDLPSLIVKQIEQYGLYIEEY